MKDSDYERERLSENRYKYTCNHCDFWFGSTSGIGERNMREHLKNCAGKPADPKWDKIREEAKELKDK
jgi:hypothetical protein